MDDCMPGFGAFLILFGLGTVALVAALNVWLTLSASATAEIFEAELPPLRRITWTACVWIVPLAGAGIWHVYRRRTRQVPQGED